MHAVTAVPGRSRPVGGLLAAWLSAGLAAALTGCGTRAPNVALPDKPGHVPAAGAAAARPTARDLVIAAYEGYWRATNEALAARDASKAGAIMAGYVPASSIPALVKGLKAIWRRSEIGYGSPVFHIMSVQITGRATRRRTAVVHDCVDLSQTGFQNQQTGQVVGGFGQSHEFLVTTLALEHGRWLVTGAIPVVQTCTY
jgi:hypothetical protein